ncbi:MAG TPA: sugar ABC transporter substrate-binding protein [Pyrinomonadaceae bacterium]|jgi:ribose transport system substrate-binding protein|nr:sugar ABC transporter substrate-binding protein [Pyrinomonadaceae bacterium]
MDHSAIEASELAAAVYKPPQFLDEAIAAVPLVAATATPNRIGYLSNYSFHIWYQIVMEVLRRRAKQYGAEVVIQDAGKSVDNQIRQAEAMIGEVDALILTPAGTSGLEPVLELAHKAGKPVVIEANPVEGMKTLIAICDYDAGFDLGVWVGQNIRNKTGSGALRILDVGLPWLRPCLLRSEGFVEGLRSVQSDAVVVASINGEAVPDVAHRVALDALRKTGDVDVIFAMDDETGQGAYEGYVEAGFDPATVAVAGFGLAGDHEKEWLMRREALKVSAAMFPEYVGLRCVDNLIKRYDGQQTPKRDVIPTVAATPELLDKLYPRKGGAWTPDFAAIAALSAKSDCTRV